MQCVLLPETLYPRQAVVLVESRQVGPGGELQDANHLGIPRTKQLGYFVRAISYYWLKDKL